MIQLILMRHGNTFEAGQTPVQVGARTDLSLTAHGLCQAREMVKYLEIHKIFPAAIYAGKLKRQTESAELLAAHFGLPFQNAPALTEIDYGLWEGLSSEEISSRWPREYAQWNDEARWQSHIFHSSYEMFRKNLDDWLSFLRKAYEGKSVIAVTSNGLLRLFKNEKVKTGHFCEVHLTQDQTEICSWNQNPCCKGAAVRIDLGEAVGR